MVVIGCVCALATILFVNYYATWSDIHSQADCYMTFDEWLQLYKAAPQKWSLGCIFPTWIYEGYYRVGFSMRDWRRYKNFQRGIVRKCVDKRRKEVFECLIEKSKEG